MSISSSLGEEHVVQLPQGRLHYRQRGSGRALVFLHGVLVNGDLWRDMVPVLAVDHCCITPDLPLGSHNVPLHPDADLTPSGMACLVADFLAALGLTGVTLVAHDTGGGYAQILATEHPARIENLVLLNCDAFDNFPPRGSRLLGRLLGRFPGSFRLIAWVLRPHAMKRLAGALVTRAGFPPEIGRSYIDHRRPPGTWRDLAKAARTIDPRFTQRAAERLRDFPGRALLLWAPHDRIFPFEHALRLAALIPRAELRTIEVSRAFIPEDQPRAAAQAIAAFLAQGTQQETAAVGGPTAKPSD